MKNIPLDPELYEEVKEEIKQRSKVWPSVYASGRLVQEYKRRGGEYARVNPPQSDYMALPSVLRLQAQAADLSSFLEETEEPLEDWVESKITKMSNDMDDVHTYVVYGRKVRKNPALSWHLRNDDVEEMLIGLVRRTGRTEDLLAILSDYYAESADYERNPELREALMETAHVLAGASGRIERIFRDLE